MQAILRGLHARDGSPSPELLLPQPLCAQAGGGRGGGWGGGSAEFPRMDTAAAERRVVILPARSPLHLTPNLPEDEGNKQAPPTLSTPGWGWGWSSKGAVTLYGASLG